MKKWASIFLFLGVLPCLTLRAATVTFNGATTYQTIDGFGVNVNHRSWNNEELKPALNALIDQAGMTLFRVLFDNTNWEATNDNADPTVMNWTYYNSVYGSTNFTPLWNLFAYLNSRGITNGAFFNFMGSGPSWMGGGALTSGLEAEWAEMIASLLTYARKTKGLQFHLVAPNNEPDISNEGIRIPTAGQYTKTLYQLARLLDSNGMSDVRFVAPDLAGGGTTYMPELMANSAVMAKLERFGAHSYSDNGGGSGGIYDYIRNSAYPSRAFWMTEFNVWCNTCDSGTRGTYDWTYCRGTADYLLHHLENGAAAGIIWEGYDSFYAHYPSTWSFWGLLSVDNQNAAVKTYTPRKNFYTVAQISKFVRPGARRLGVSGATSPFSPLLAFSHSDLGQVAIVGINTSGSAATLNGALTSLPSISYLDLYYTSASANLAYAGRVTVDGGKFSATIPADCVFTLTGSASILFAVATDSLPNGIVDEVYETTLEGSGGTLPYTWSLVDGSLPPDLTLNTANGTLSGTPTTPGTFSFTVQLSDADDQTVSKTLSIIITSVSTAITIWPSTTTPSVADGGPDKAVEAGVKFKSDVAGMITGLRFYKAGANTGIHIGNLWSSAGAWLATVTFSNETASGWQEALFATPAAIASNTIYVASYHANNGHYSSDINYFQGKGVDNPPLHALTDGVSGGNGVYAYGTSSAFPNQTWYAANYWVDVVFQAVALPTLISIEVTPANPTIASGNSQQFTAMGTYSDGSAQNVASQATWTSSNTGVATINAVGLATGISAGVTTISATLAGVVETTTFTVQSAPLVLTTTSLPDGTAKKAYTATLAAGGGTTPYTWSILSGTLPAGLTLNSKSGVISGKPTASGTFSFVARVSDAGGQTASQTLNITILSTQRR